MSPLCPSGLCFPLRKKNKAEISIGQQYDSDDSSRVWEPSDNAETPEARYARCEREALVAAAIQRLPVIFREILELQDSTDYSIIQIAEALGISVAAAKSRLMRAKDVAAGFKDSDSWRYQIKFFRRIVEAKHLHEICHGARADASNSISSAA